MKFRMIFGTESTHMAYDIFFREGKDIFTAANFITLQPQPHRELLQTITHTLSLNGQIVHPLVTKTGNGEWSVLLKEDTGDVYVYTLFISSLEQEAASRVLTAETLPEKLELVVIDPAGEKDSVGGYHPGYWSVAHYASLLEEEQKKLFLKTVEQITYNIPSVYYTKNEDGSISIHIHKQDRAYTISVACRAEWRWR